MNERNCKKNKILVCPFLILTYNIMVLFSPVVEIQVTKEVGRGTFSHPNVFFPIFSQKKERKCCSCATEFPCPTYLCLHRAQLAAHPVPYKCYAIMLKTIFLPDSNCYNRIVWSSRACRWGRKTLLLQQLLSWLEKMHKYKWVFKYNPNKHRKQHHNIYAIDLHVYKSIWAILIKACIP